MSAHEWMVYGAYGYTGRLIVAEAVRRGLRPVLAGRDVERLETMAGEHGLPYRAFVLEEPAAVRNGLNEIGLVLHCAGPFSATCAPMLEACLDAGAHYLDITGEIGVFAHCHAQHDRAQRAGIVVLPGAGFDVVPTDCMAAQLKRELPGADSLVLAFEAGGGPSPGTARTGVEGLARGGCVRTGGELRRVPLAWKRRTFEWDGERRHAVSIPWGDVYTAYVSTGIPNIEVYMAMPAASITRLRRLRWLRPVLGLAPVQAWLKRRVERSVSGPSQQRRARSDCRIWGEARDPDGTVCARRLLTPNGYELTATASLGIVERLLRDRSVAAGFATPSRLMGADYVLTLPGVKRL